MLLLRKPWDSQPQETAAESSPSFLWNAATAPGVAKVPGMSGAYMNATNNNAASTNLVTAAPRTAVVVFAAPTGSVGGTQIFRIGSTGPANGIRLDVSTGSASVLAQWTLNGFANLNVLTAGPSTFTTRAYVAVLSWDINNTTSWFGPIGGNSPFDTSGITTGSTAAAIISSTETNVQLNGGSFPIYAVAVLPFMVGNAQAREIITDPWQLFAPRSIWVPVSTGGGTTYTIIPSGGIAFSGVGTETNGKIIAPSGGVTFAGTGSATFTSGGTSYVISPTGGITFAGIGTQVKSKTIIPTGGISFAGTGLGLRTKIVGVSGGVTFSGTGNMTSNTSSGTGQTGERTKVGVGT